MTDEMTKFFGLDNPAGQVALAKEREKLEAELRASLYSWRSLAASALLRRLIGKDAPDKEA